MGIAKLLHFLAIGLLQSTLLLCGSYLPPTRPLRGFCVILNDRRMITVWHLGTRDLVARYLMSIDRLT